MAHLCLISPGQISRNPRGVRNADSLAAAGHVVTVVYADYLPAYRAFDASILATARWRAVGLDFGLTAEGRRRWQFVRLRHYFARNLMTATAGRLALGPGYGYFGPELAAAARDTGADFFLAQEQKSSLAAASAGRFGIDVEDLHADCDDGPRHAIATLERRQFPRAQFLATMSAAAAARIAEVHPRARPPVVLHNCPSLAERGSLAPPAARGGPLRLYWFGQTVGPHSCADTVLRAIALLPRGSVRLTLRGSDTARYNQVLLRLAADLGIADFLRIEPPAPPAQMVALAAEHDVLLGTQPSPQLFHQCAVGNKVFTGLMAGCASLLSDTIAHRQLAAAHPGDFLLYPTHDAPALARELAQLSAAPDRLLALRARSWALAAHPFNWETQSRALVEAVEESLHTTSARPTRRDGRLNRPRSDPRRILHRLAIILTFGLILLAPVSNALREFLRYILDLALRSRSRSRPFVALHEPGPLLVVAPHPDDETLGCGGLIARRRAAGLPVSIVWLTDGADSHPGHPIVTPAALATLRAREAHEAAALLGVPAHDLHFLNARDGQLSHLRASERDLLVGRIAALLSSIAPATIALPCRHDGSDEHDAAFPLVVAARARAGSTARLVEFPVWSWWSPWLLLRPLRSSHSVHRLDTTSVLATKVAALDCYRSEIRPIAPDTVPSLSPAYVDSFRSDSEYFFLTRAKERPPRAES
ncbi:MAG: hypothetical protein RLZZ15_4082 [Verrucomicrobiota bacterium]